MIQKYGLYMAWLVVTLGTMISFYYSDIKNIEPCHLCWLQRVCLLPLFFLLGIATYKGFHEIALYALPQILVGFFLALYQVAIQEIPGWNPIDICGAGPSCSEKISIGLGPITIPMVSAFGFLLIGALLITTWVSNNRRTAFP